ncbi:MAG: hypothetical protein KKF48_01550 [Nanoarchaeota archaeon]|nr:hypothetical protein [Nanoarchaeota archaeon]MBU1027706.1 hypothetical protein [Nanoarchaeota archaeon]
MAEKETIFSSKMKYKGIFSFQNFYKFCYNWVIDELDLDINEDKYKETITGDSKEIEVKWTGKKDVTDFFQVKIEFAFIARALTQIEIMQDNTKVKTNKGIIEVKIKGILVSDYKGKFELSAFKKFLRGIYEKWVISSRIDQLKTKLANDCDDFLSQAKAYLDLEGKR